MSINMRVNCQFKSTIELSPDCVDGDVFASRVGQKSEQLVEESREEVDEGAHLHGMQALRTAARESTAANTTPGHRGAIRIGVT